MFVCKPLAFHLQQTRVTRSVWVCRSAGVVQLMMIELDLTIGIERAHLPPSRVDQHAAFGIVTEAVFTTQLDADAPVHRRSEH